MCIVVPMPGEAKLSMPSLALPQATSSGTLLNFEAAGTTNTKGRFQHDGEAIGLCPRQTGGGDVAAGAGAIVDNHRPDERRVIALACFSP